MRVSISNIAWDVADDQAVAALLKDRGVDAVDVAPGKYFADIEGATSADIAAVRAWWGERGLDIVGMQSLLFGAQGMNLFDESDVQEAMLNRLEAVCRIGDGLGARKLVFGSPKNRDRRNLDAGEAVEVAAEFFRRLGARAMRYGVTICLEPNPPVYGANFMTTAEETATVVSAVEHPAIRMQLDTGALAINAEDPGETIRRYAPLIGHVHASEPGLVTLGEGDAPHAAIGALIRKHIPDQTVTIEMLPSKTMPSLEAISTAVETAMRFYGDRVQ